MNTPSFQDRPPLTERVNAYDERHLVTYLRLLDAEAEGADWQEVVQVIFGLDPAHEPDRARTVHDTHLARARWMTETGYRHLLEPRMQSASGTAAAARDATLRTSSGSDFPDRVDSP